MINLSRGGSKQAAPTFRLTRSFRGTPFTQSLRSHKYDHKDKMGQASGGPDFLVLGKENCVAPASSLKLIFNGFLYCLGQNEASRDDYIIAQKPENITVNC